MIKKFKGYNRKTKTMGDPFTLQDAIGSRKLDGVDTSEVEYIQWTGRLDKNGVEIYEKDVVDSRFIGKATVELIGGRYFPLVGVKNDHISSYNPSDFEVVGNELINK